MEFLKSSQTSFRGETSGGIAKCRLFSQVSKSIVTSWYTQWWKWHDLKYIIFFHVYPQVKMWCILYNSSHVIPPLGILGTYIWPALQLPWLAQWIERGPRAFPLVIAKVKVRFLVKSEFFQVLFQPLKLIIQLRGSHSFLYIYPQFTYMLYFIYPNSSILV